jgi:hypothetical protein
MIQNVIIIAIVAAAVILLIRHFRKGKCSCCEEGDEKDKTSGCKFCGQDNKK